MEQQSNAANTVHWLNKFFLGSNVLLGVVITAAQLAAMRALKNLGEGFNMEPTQTGGSPIPWIITLVSLASIVGFFKFRERPDTSFKIQAGVFCGLTTFWVLQVSNAMKPIMTLIMDLG